jgi:hypothetical protein
MYDLRIYNHHVGVVGSGIVFLKQKKKKNNASCYLLRWKNLLRRRCCTYVTQYCFIGLARCHTVRKSRAEITPLKLTYVTSEVKSTWREPSSGLKHVVQIKREKFYFLTYLLLGVSAKTFSS